MQGWSKRELPCGQYAQVDPGKECQLFPLRGEPVVEVGMSFAINSTARKGVQEAPARPWDPAASVPLPPAGCRRDHHSYADLALRQYS